MKNQFKLALAALTIAVTIVACDPPKAAPDTEDRIDTTKAGGIDTTQKDTTLQIDPHKKDSVK